MKVMIIDDERLAREELKRLLKQHAELEVVAEAANIVEAQELIRKTVPDLIFLDIQMPGGTGFDLLQSLDDTPEVIFTTAFDQYALRAFDVSALDYLLKPIEPARFAQAVQKAMLKIKPDDEQTTPLASDGKVFIKDGERCWFVALDQIALFESEGNYTRVYFDQQRPLMLRSLNQLEARLDASKFLRVSRSQIVNMAFVENMVTNTSGGMTLTLKGDLKVSMSRRRAAEFKQANRL
ncbi:LytR/AlgR family response regulator transcription factor [Undibacterium sp.]|uniref:LytR/AlgR family response regulator transcription factor n=1 Tax=Undibacterium sp. TaxID=1914977 RepID=UPI0037515B82